MSIHDFFRDLNSNRCGRLFFGFLVLSVCFILLPLRQVWAWIVLPAVPLAAYIAALVYSQRVYYVAHSIEIKNSAYIFGFLLTLIAICNLFIQSGEALMGRGLNENDVNSPFVIGQIGAAIVSTVVGLLGRQVLVTGDPLEADQDEVYRDLTKTLRENAIELDQAQKQLIDVVKDFVTQREVLFQDEERAFQRFVTGLEKGEQLLTNLEITFPERLGAVLESFREHVVALDQSVGACSSKLEALTATGQEAQEALAGSSQRLVVSLEVCVSGINSALKDVVEKVSSSADAFDHVNEITTKIHTDIHTNLSVTKDDLRDLSTQISELSERFTAFSSAIDTTTNEVTEKLVSIPDDFSTAVQGMADQSSEAYADVQARLKELVNDLRAMDQIVDQVSNLWQRRLSIKE